jgi:hypothetical protein
VCVCTCMHVYGFVCACLLWLTVAHRGCVCIFMYSCASAFLSPIHLGYSPICDSNKECPTCRGECATRRALRPDSQFDQLISRLYPDRQAYEARVDEIENEIANARQHNVLAASVREGIARQRASARALKSSARRRAAHRQQVLCFRLVIGDPDLADREVSGDRPTCAATTTPAAAAASAAHSTTTLSAQSRTAAGALDKQEEEKAAAKQEEEEEEVRVGPMRTNMEAKDEAKGEQTLEEVQVEVSMESGVESGERATQVEKVRAELCTLRWVQASAAASVWDVKRMLSGLCEGELPPSSYRIRTALGKELTSDLGLLELRRQATPDDLKLYVQVDC